MEINKGGRIEFSIPQELVFQILRELPVKTLLRFRVVSKLWRSIIDDPAFIDSHRTRSYTRPGGIRLISEFKQHDRHATYLSKFYSTDPEGGSPLHFLTIEPPAHLLTLSPYSSGHYDYIDCLQSVHGLVYKDQTIYNPSTRESIPLPPVTINMQVDIRGVDKDRYKIVPQYLLGFDSSTNTYKVLNVSRIILPHSERIEYRVLTLGTNSWKILDVPDQLRNVRFTRNSGLRCIDDVIFCLAITDTNEFIRDPLLLAFEVGPEKFRVMKLPTDYGYIVQVGQHLALMNADDVRDPEEDADVDDFHARTFEVMTTWILEDYENQIWKKLESFMSPALGIMRNEADINIKETSTEAIGTIHTSEVLFHSEGWVSPFRNNPSFGCCFYYDLKSNNFRLVPKLLEFPEEYDGPLSRSFVNFTKHVECLFKLKGLAA